MDHDGPAGRRLLAGREQVVLQGRKKNICGKMKRLSKMRNNPLFTVLVC